MTTELPTDRVITANGEYYLDPVKHGLSQGRECIFEVDLDKTGGTFGGRTVTLGYEGDSGNFVAFRDALRNPIQLVEAEGIRVPVPRSGRLAVKVEGGGDDPKIAVSAIIIRLSPL